MKLTHTEGYPVQAVCKLLGYPRSSYYYQYEAHQNRLQPATSETSTSLADVEVRTAHSHTGRGWAVVYLWIQACDCSVASEPGGGRT